jgi:Superfamily I DNA and RNA helicases and helicase subunits
MSQDKAVELFSMKDELQFEINKADIKAKLSANRPSMDMVAAGSAISILIREGEKKRKQKNIRQLLSEIGDLVQIIKPCFLMSPLSVSTYLASAKIKFDTVIFDEASQIFPQDAIGTIYRGNQIIVVGDSKQMPPSNFFGSSVDSNEDEEEDNISDFESILDLCATSLPQLRLKWHYCSRYEQLISFSNKNFYDNSLVTFPSSKTDEKWIGVDYYNSNGIFDHKSRTNVKEAECVVDLIYENIQKYPDRSLGVVAFSISQQDLIERILANWCANESNYSRRSWRSDEFDNFKVALNAFNNPYYNVYISRLEMYDTMLFLQHNEQLTEMEIVSLRVLSERLNKQYKDIEKSYFSTNDD